MISHSIITRSSAGASSIAQIDSYYKDAKDDYYAKDNQPSQWQGKLAEELGLNGEVKKENFIDLMAGKDPRNYKNTLRQDKFNSKDSNTRLAIDLTFSAPKSISIESLVNGNIEVMKAHELAVKKTLELIEKNAETRKKSKGITVIENTGKLAIGTFRHETNRNQDPHLHTHAVIINLTKREDGQFRALHNEEIIKRTKEYTKVYQTYLATSLKEQGFNLRITKDGFELAHINDAQIQAFSSRSKEVNEALESKGLTRENATTADKQSATLDTRQMKVEKDIVQVRHAWKKVANQLGIVSKPSKQFSNSGQEIIPLAIGFSTFENPFNQTHEIQVSFNNQLLKSESLNAKEKSSTEREISAGISGFSAGATTGAGNTGRSITGAGISGFSAGATTGAGNTGRSTTGAGISDFTAGLADFKAGIKAQKSEENHDKAFNRTNAGNVSKSRSHANDQNSRNRNGYGIYEQVWLSQEKNIGNKISYSTFQQDYSAGTEDTGDNMRTLSGKPMATWSKPSDVLLPIDQEIQLQFPRTNELIGLRGSGNSLPSDPTGRIDETLDDILDLDQVDLSLKEQWKEKLDALKTESAEEELYFNNVENLKEFIVKHLTDKDHVIKESNMKNIIMEKGLGVVNYDDLDSILSEMVEDKQIVKTEAKYEKKGVLYSEYSVRDILGIYEDIDEKYFDKILKENGFKKSEAIYTTQRAIDEDKEIIQRLNDSQGMYNPTYNKSEALERLAETTLNDEQKACALMVLSSDNSILGIQGYAGTGKSFMISRTKELIEDKGKEMVLFAPYSAQVKNLVNDGLEANTVAKFLVSKEIQDNLNENSVIVIDESGVINSKQMKEILEIREKIGCQLVLLGDTAQTKAVEAGTPFELLQKNGMETTKMADIQRQKNLVLRKAVVSSVQGDFSNALDNLENLTEIEKKEDRHKVLVDKYLSLNEEEREKTLIVSGTNDDRQSINNLIREQIGTLGKGVEYTKLSQRDTSKAEVDYAISFNAGEYVVFGKSDKRRKIESGESYKVIGRNVKQNKVELEKEDGTKLLVSPSGLQAGIFEESKIELSAGDKVRVTKSYDDFKTGDLLTIESVSKDTGIALAKDSDNKLLEIDLSKKHYLDYAYAMTVHASQGLTYDNVIVDLNTKSQTTSQETFYVGISRARNNAFVYTNSIDEMPESISRSATKHNAIELMDYGYKNESDNYSNNHSDNGIILNNSNVYKGINVQFKDYINENEERLNVFEQIKFNHSKVRDENTKGAELLNFASDLADEKIKLESILIKDFNENKVDGLFAETSIGIVSLTKSAKEDGKWQVTQFYGKDNLPLSDSGNQDIERAVEDFIYAIDFSKLQLEQNMVKSNNEIKAEILDNYVSNPNLADQVIEKVGGVDKFIELAEKGINDNVNDAIKEYMADKDPNQSIQFVQNNIESISETLKNNDIDISKLDLSNAETAKEIENLAIAEMVQEYSAQLSIKQDMNMSKQESGIDLRAVDLYDYEAHDSKGMVESSSQVVGYIEDDLGIQVSEYKLHNADDVENSYITIKANSDYGDEFSATVNNSGEWTVSGNNPILKSEVKELGINPDGVLEYAEHGLSKYGQVELNSIAELKQYAEKYGTESQLENINAIVNKLDQLDSKEMVSKIDMAFTANETHFSIDLNQGYSPSPFSSEIKTNENSSASISIDGERVSIVSDSVKAERDDILNNNPEKYINIFGTETNQGIDYVLEKVEVAVNNQKGKNQGMELE